MRIKGIISQEVLRNESTVYITITPMSALLPATADTFSESLQDDIDMVNIITNMMCEHKDFTLFAAMPSQAVCIGDTVDIVCEVKQMYDDFFVMPNYSCLNITHSKLYYERVIEHYWNVIKEAAIN
jgi:hypothetical protein